MSKVLHPVTSAGLAQDVLRGEDDRPEVDRPEVDGRVNMKKALHSKVVRIGFFLHTSFWDSGSKTDNVGNKSDVSSRLSPVTGALAIA
eukprot:5712137-Prymnesium_polylepis.2